jgi:hypothetical protein
LGGKSAAGAGATGLLEFIHNPGDAIVDNATDKLADWLHDSKQAAAAPPTVPAQPITVQPQKVIAEGAIERYFAQRDAELAAAANPAPRRNFGRKGL